MRPAIVVVLVASLVLLVAGGCESDRITGPPPLGGWIEGNVSDGGEGELAGLRIRVDAIAADGSVTEYGTYTDERGYYCLGVPDGRAVVWFDRSSDIYYRAGGPTPAASQADTLVVDGQVQRADFPCGRARVVISDGVDAPTGVWSEIDLSSCVPPDDDGWGRIRVLFGNGNLEEVDGTLEATFRFLPPLPHVARSRGDDPYPGRFYLPASYRAVEADTLAITPGEITTYTTETPEPATLAGRIEGSWQLFGFPPPLVAVHEAGGQWVARTACGTDGRFSIDLPAAGDFRLSSRVEDEDGDTLSPSRWVGGHRFDQAQVFALECGESVTGIEDEEGGLTLAITGDPEMTEVYVRAYAEGGTNTAWAIGAEAGDLLRIANVEPGSYRLQVETDGLALPTFHGGALSLEDATPIEVRAHEITSVGVALQLGGRILGHLRAPDGDGIDAHFQLAVHAADVLENPIHEFSVDWSWDDGFQYDRTTGAFEVRRLQAGSYKLRILVEGDAAWRWYPDADNWEDAAPIAVEAGADVTGIEWQP